MTQTTIEPVIWLRNLFSWLSIRCWRWHLWNIKTFRRYEKDDFNKGTCRHRKLDTAWDRYWWKETR